MIYLLMIVQASQPIAHDCAGQLVKRLVLLRMFVPSHLMKRQVALNNGSLVIKTSKKQDAGPIIGRRQRPIHQRYISESSQGLAVISNQH